MDDKILEEVKKKMGYQGPQQKFCRDCKFCEERDGFAERTWESFCTYPRQTMGKFFKTIGEFRVEENGFCNEFEKKK
jgi:hypothetical protein